MNRPSDTPRVVTDLDMHLACREASRLLAATGYERQYAASYQGHMCSPLQEGAHLSMRGAIILALSHRRAWVRWAVLQRLEEDRFLHRSEPPDKAAALALLQAAAEFYHTFNLPQREDIS